MRITTICLLVWKKQTLVGKSGRLDYSTSNVPNLLAFEIQLETHSNKVTGTERANSNENSYTCLTKRGYFLGENKVNTKWWTRRLIIPQVRAFFWEWSSGKPSSYHHDETAQQQARFVRIMRLWWTFCHRLNEVLVMKKITESKIQQGYHRPILTTRDKILLFHVFCILKNITF